MSTSVIPAMARVGFTASPRLLRMHFMRTRTGAVTLVAGLKLYVDKRKCSNQFASAMKGSSLTFL
jgi:hypothetical protein